MSSMLRPLTLALSLVAAAGALSAARADKYTVNAVVLKLPIIDIDQPKSLDIPVGGVFTSKDVDYFCGTAGDKLIPLGRMHVRKKAPWIFTVDDPALEVYAIAGKSCFRPIQGEALPEIKVELWVRAPASYNKSPASIKLDISLPPKPPTIEVALGDDLTAAVATPFAMPAGKPVWHPISVTSASRRDVELYVFGAGEHVGFGNEGAMYMARTIKGVARPDQPFTTSVMAEPGTSVTIVAIQPGKTIPTERDVYGVPSATDKVYGHELNLFAFFSPAEARMTRDNADLAARLFTTIDPAFFVYGVGERAPCHLVAGEPVLLLDQSRIMHANGMVQECSFRQGEPATDYLSTQRPAKLVMPEVIAQANDQNRVIWYDEDFLAQAATDKGIAAYKATKALASACYSREWDKMDPNHTADQYDIVSYSGGKVAKVESFGDKVFKQVYAACNLAGLEKQRDAIYTRLAKTFQVEEKKRLDDISKRLASL